MPLQLQDMLAGERSGRGEVQGEPFIERACRRASRNGRKRATRGAGKRAQQRQRRCAAHRGPIRE